MQNPKLKPNAGRFAKWWYRHQVKRSNRKYDIQDKKRKWTAIRYYSMLGIAIFFVIAAHITMKSTNVQSTELNKEMSFGNDGKSAVITKRIFNPNTGTLLLKFRIDSGDSTDFTAVDLDKIKLSFDGDRYRTNDTKLMVYPTSQNTVALQYLNVKHNFQDVQVKFHDKAVNDTNVGAVSSLSSSSSSSKGLTDQDTTIIVNNDKVSIDKELQPRTQKKLAVEQVDDDIDTQNKLIIANNNAISKLNDLIKDQEKDIKLKRAQSDSLTSDEQQKLDSSIQNDQARITTLKDKISDAKDEIRNAKAQISTLNDNKSKYEHGKLDLPKPY
ncbi:hypothetical protein ESZ50_00745 [Weissella muntiaci]|uniref:Uncharacterized protein n=1 Tax=Weissella muntiaci TaxID=2508881 RepID=A0A6C2CCY8_9LACO|nr:hypothetical protein [Weissella muntiaci]TYC51095.1 hypothetical protein ESZ50_00745 [Weissella muntiaci]